MAFEVYREQSDQCLVILAYFELLAMRCLDPALSLSFSISFFYFFVLTQKSNQKVKAGLPTFVGTPQNRPGLPPFMMQRMLYFYFVA